LLPVPSTGWWPLRSLARSASSSSTSAFSSFQRVSSGQARALLRQQLVLRRPRARPMSMPMAFSRPMMPSSVSSASMRLRASSTSAGVACRLTATRAQAVSSRLTDLSGSWRAGM
jgi:hypothetical protein